MLCYAWKKYADEVENMRKQLPKNVRQIGNVSDSSKIYVEDYVDTFLNQLCDKNGQESAGAFLVGEIERDKDEEYIYIYGALRMKQIEVKGKEISFGENTWKRACEQCKKYFGDAAILGWALAMPGQALEMHPGILKLHQRYLPKEKTIFIMKDSETKEEKYFVHKFKDLLEWGGHYIYYEKNVEMQNYMIDMRKRNGVTPSESVEDRAAASFRNVIKERMEQNEQKRHSKFSYAVSMLLVLVVLVIGVSMMNNFERMEGVQKSLDVISNTVLNNKEEDEVQKLEILPKEDVEEEEEINEETNEEEEEPAEELEDVEAEVEENEESEEVDMQPVIENAYIVQKGDTLASISRAKYGDSSHVEEICKMNGLEDGNLIFIGQKLLLP